DVGEYGEADRVLVKTLRCGGTANAATVFSAGVFGDLEFSFGRDVGKEFSDAAGESFDVLMVQVFTADSFALRASGSDFAVGQTFSFRFLQGRLFYEQALALVASSGTAEFQDDGGKY